jgi:hypothetical protein
MVLSLGQEIENSGMLGWAHEMRAWFVITSGDYREAIAVAEGGQLAAGQQTAFSRPVACDCNTPELPGPGGPTEAQKAFASIEFDVNAPPSGAP